MIAEKLGGNVKKPFTADRASGCFDLFISDLCV